jgi:hypothetical protein
MLDRDIGVPTAFSERGEQEGAESLLLLKSERNRQHIYIFPTFQHVLSLLKRPARDTGSIVWHMIVGNLEISS